MEHIIEPASIRTGTVYVSEGCIVHEPLHGRIIQIALNEIALVGEYTINDHPLHKGVWHVAFVKKDGSWQSIPSLTQQMPQLLEYLAYYFKTDFSLYDLTTTIRAKSIIRHPDALNGRPLFIITPPANFKPPATLLQKAKLLFQATINNREWQFELTPEAKAFLQNN